jgi:hypothetical protein
VSFDDLAIYLRLAPEFGGTRFGPFESLEVRLGSDADNCHIVLQAELGVQPDHVKLIRQGAKNLILAPSDRTAGVFLWKREAQRPVQLTTATAVRPGDAFALVTPEGPRFIVELDELPEELQEARAKRSGPATGRGRISKDAFAQEGKRQVWSRLLTMGPAQMAQRAFTYISSGAIFRPRNIIMGLVLCSGWIAGGGAMCSRRSMKTSLKVTNERYESCSEERAFAENLRGDSTEFSFEQLAANVVGSVGLGTTLSNDEVLRGAVKQRAKGLLTNAQSFNWLVQAKGSRAAKFANWRERVTGEDDIDVDSQALLVWLAATTGRGEFADRSDSETNQVCGRGLTRMTYRQAISLGMDAQPDAYIHRDVESVRENRTQREEMLTSTMQAAGAGELPESFETSITPINQGLNACVHLDGEDDRMRPKAIVKMLARSMAKDAEDLPPGDDSPGAGVARVAKFWASDLTLVDYRQRDPGISFADAQVSTVLDPWEARGQWVLKQTADTIARAIVIPCLVVLKGEDPAKAENVFGQDLPSPVNCLVMDWKLRNQR